MTIDDHSNSCTHGYHHIAQHIQDLSDNTQQNSLHSMEENASLFADDTTTPCDFNIIKQHSVTENANDTDIPCTLKQSGIHSQCKHTYRNTFGKSNIQYHDLTIKTHSHLQINTQHYYNKNYKIHNTSDTTIECLHGQEMAYFDARSKGLVQMNNLKHFPIDQYLHDRITPATLSPTPLAYEKPIHPTEIPCITTCTELPVDNTNKSTSDDKYPWLESDDIRRNMTDTKIL